jgi:hypothetical protein
MKCWGLGVGVVLYALVGCGNAQQGFSGSGTAGAGDAGGAAAGVSGRAGQAGAMGGSGGAAASSGSAGLSGAGSGGMKSDPCLGKVCNAAPVPTCVSSFQQKNYDPMGTCLDGECKYVEHLVGCSCDAGQCTPTDICPGITCGPSPAPVCKDEKTLHKVYVSGMCSGGICQSISTDTTCVLGCADGACLDKPCDNTTCPSNTLCADPGPCVLCATDTACGAACTACGDATPKCKNSSTKSQCVACLADLDCGAGKRCDTAGNTCIALKADGELCAAAPECASKACSGRCCPSGTSCFCPQPSSGNLLTNPFFDSNISGWGAVSEASDTFAWADATKTKGDCPYSGSMELTTTAPAGNSTSQFSECVNIDPASTKNYYFGAAMRNGDSDGNNKCTLGECSLQWMSGANCASPEGTPPIKVQSSSAAWGFSTSAQLVRPTAASSARIACLVRSGATGSSCVFGFDQLSFTEAPDKY